MSPDAKSLLGATGVGGEVRNSHSGSATAHGSDPVGIDLGNEASVRTGITAGTRRDAIGPSVGTGNSSASAAELTDWTGLRSWFGGLETAG